MCHVVPSGIIWVCGVWCVRVLSSGRVFLCLCIVSLCRVFLSCLCVFESRRVFVSCPHADASCLRVAYAGLRVVSTSRAVSLCPVYHVLSSSRVCRVLVSSHHVFVSCLQVGCVVCALCVVSCVFVCVCVPLCISVSLSAFLHVCSAVFIGWPASYCGCVCAGAASIGHAGDRVKPSSMNIATSPEAPKASNPNPRRRGF